MKEWIERISIKHESLNGFSVCPFAKGSEYEVIETDGSDVNPPPWDFELIIYKFPDNYTEFEIIELAKEYKLERDMENCVEFLAWKHAKMVFKDGSTLAFNIKRYTNT